MYVYVEVRSLDHFLMFQLRTKGTWIPCLWVCGSL